MTDLRFCFRIEKEANMAEDEQGNPAECYSQIKLSECKNPPDDFEATHKRIAELFAKRIYVNPDWVTPISEAEYDAEVEEES